MSVIIFVVLTVLMWNMVGYKFVTSYNVGEARCVERERDALLRFKKGLKIDNYGFLSSWGSEDHKKECCEWEGIWCGNATGHVTALFLNGLRGDNISSALLELHHLKVLDLSGNDFGSNKIPEFICSMTQLQQLNLSACNFSGIIPPHIGNLSNLQTLDLSSNDFRKNKIPESICSMKKLEELNLRGSNFYGTIPPELGNLTNLKTLDLSYNDFGKSKIPEPIGTMKKLGEMNLRISILFGIDTHQLGNLTNLETLDLSGNSLLIIDNLNWLHSHILLFSRLDFSYVNITDPNCLQYVVNLPSLQEIIFQNCGLIEAKKPSSSSSSGFSFNFSSSTPSLFILDLSRNDLTSSKIDWLHNHVASNLRELHLQSNELKWLPTSIWQLHKLEKLDVSFNSLEGTITEANLANFQNLKYLDLSFNSLILRINPNWTPPFQLELINLGGCDMGLGFPLWLRTQNDLQIIDLSFAGLTGQVPKWFWDLSVGLLYLNIAHNQLVGEIPNCWENMTGLNILNLENNSFSGKIPRGLGSLSQLCKLQLGNNNLSGELPSTLKNCKKLQLIDVGGNMLTGNIPSWIGAAYHESLTYLIFRDNRFEGSIPPQICSLAQIQVLDLSGNHLSGKIPLCFNNFTLLVQMNITISPFWRFSSHYRFTGHDNQEYVDSAIVSWKGQYLGYKKSQEILKLIDLSSNRLVGDIPRSLFSLRELIFLNLSRNSLTGIIHPDIGEMKMLKALDLSSNQLSGAIPNGITQLHFLAAVDFANNNFSGKIPTGGQLVTFMASIYAGNTGLCGSPLPLCSQEVSDPSINDDDDGILSFPFLEGLVISIVLGFIFGFWGVVGSLIVKESWRRAYFNFWDAVGNRLYVTTAIFWAKLIRRS